MRNHLIISKLPQTEIGIQTIKQNFVFRYALVSHRPDVYTYAMNIFRF